MTTSADMFDPAARKAAFEASGQREKAKRLLDALDMACICCDLPCPVGEAGVDYVLGLSVIAMANLRWQAKLKRPPSQQTLDELFALIRGRS